ncbi:hypothetical protein CCAX7_44340 [Capsulimonas corticalis]|uniref:Uncharacterized protein n=1 Tax=Capsulimonas corticalis TaxID=2219043 RepID=A0A402CX82_9BACT|nr:hypothetical protein [Capsulimonas corticalis]BDI32383.1 hypothetical protein CCAX7_44340 [Capsulimonas corticalis]
MTTNDEQLITITEACSRLGLSERTIRRYLKTDLSSEQTVAKQRRTLTGLRTTTYLTPETFGKLAEKAHLRDQLIRGESTPAENTGATQANDRQVSATASPNLERYEALLATQEQHIADLQAALEYERERSRAYAEDAADAERELARLRRRLNMPLWRRILHAIFRQ